MNFIENLEAGITRVINLEWSEISTIATVPQLDKFNYANEIENKGLPLPYCILQFGDFRPSSDHTGVSVVFDVSIGVYYVAGSESFSSVTDGTLLQSKLAGFAQRVAGAYLGEGVTMVEGTLSLDATENNPVSMHFLRQGFPLTGGGVMFDVMCGFRIEQETLEE